ncbi:hypothetical protein [Streptomyces sp. A0642]|uniref:hypothetical protein n=1 Tax=Streptomyces sp. A0642 TaxID=2563100 RepID=UPI0019D11202|nr:hypothetical protein [Streptomyces sp. A0642]
MRDAGDFRVGDVLSVACPTTTTVERGVTWDELAVRWPWWDIDPAGEFGHWNGIAALGVGSGGRVSPDVEAELFRGGRRQRRGGHGPKG